MRAAAERLLGRREVRCALRELAARRAGPIVAVGDSLTVDSLSWARILAAALRRVAPGSGVTVRNLGVPGDTTVHIVSRFEQLMAADPGLVLVLAGTNDARVHGTAGGRILVPDAETAHNLALISRLTRQETRATISLITPPPVMEERIRAAPRLVAERVSWRCDAVERKAAVVRGLDEHVIDSRLALARPLERLLRADGLHLTLAGQERLAALVATSLSGGQRSTGR